MNFISRHLIPDLICKTVYDIPAEIFSERNIQCVIFDIDNTLAPYSRAAPDERLKKWLLSFQDKGIRVALISNNSEERVRRFNRELGFFTVYKAGKPKKKSLEPFFREFPDVDRGRILFVGDQLLTDVLAARRNKLAVVAVEPIEKAESLFFRFKRALEKPFIRQYYKRKGLS